MSKLFEVAAIAGLVVASLAFTANAQPKTKAECKQTCEAMATKDAKYTECHKQCDVMKD